MIRRRRPRKKFHINKRDLRPENIIFTCVNTLIMLCVIVVMLYPFWNPVAVSLMMRRIRFAVASSYFKSFFYVQLSERI